MQDGKIFRQRLASLYVVDIYTILTAMRILLLLRRMALYYVCACVCVCVMEERQASGNKHQHIKHLKIVVNNSRVYSRHEHNNGINGSQESNEAGKAQAFHPSLDDVEQVLAGDLLGQLLQSVAEEGGQNGTSDVGPDGTASPCHSTHDNQAKAGGNQQKASIPRRQHGREQQPTVGQVEDVVDQVEDEEEGSKDVQAVDSVVGGEDEHL